VRRIRVSKEKEYYVFIEGSDFEPLKVNEANLSKEVDEIVGNGNDAEDLLIVECKHVKRVDVSYHTAVKIIN
jgi:hypothetical protein